MTRLRSRRRAIPLALLFVLCLSFSTALILAQEPEAQDKTATAEEMNPPAPGTPTAEQIANAKAREQGSSATPPKTGKFVGDHWTPYEPPDPESFPKGSEIHIIEKGDTLWDLSAKFLGNPWLWPQIWDVNQYITDSHWIYPGDPLLLPGAPTVISELPEPATVAPETPEAAPPEPEQPQEEEPEVAEAPPAPMLPPPPALAPIANNAEIYCSNRIVGTYEKPALIVAEKEEGAKTLLSDGDIVFLNGGSSQGVEPGQVYSIVRPEHEVFHPIRTSERIGTSVRSIARLKVLVVQDEGATAEIIDACDAVKVGDALLPFEEIPVPISTPVAFDQYGVQLKGENDGYIVHVMDDKASFGSGDIVNIDLGSESGIQPGDIFTIFREWGGTVQFASTQMYIAGQQARAEEMKEKGETLPQRQIILGQLVVLGTQDKTSTAKVLVSVREMSVGDRVELR